MLLAALGPQWGEREGINEIYKTKFPSPGKVSSERKGKNIGRHNVKEFLKM